MWILVPLAPHLDGPLPCTPLEENDFPLLSYPIWLGKGDRRYQSPVYVSAFRIRGRRGSKGQVYVPALLKS